jgi:hypothetical protein
VSTTVQLPPSSIAHRLMWFSCIGMGMRSHITPGATGSATPGAGTVSKG